MKQKLKKTLNEYQHELIMLKAEHLELLIWYKTICGVNEKSQKENAKLHRTNLKYAEYVTELEQQLSEIKGEKLMKDEIGCTIHKNIKWNKFNNVYQCHSCGEIFIPKSSVKTLDRGEVEKILNQFKSIPCSSLNWLTDNDGKKVGYIPLKGSYIVSELTDKNIEFITNAICKLEVKEEQYKHVGYIKMHFADYGSDADDVRPVLALQTLRDILNYKDGNYKIYLEEQ